MGKKNKHSKKGNKDDVSETNPLYKTQQQFLQSLSEKERSELFNPEIDGERRATLWMEQADLGEGKAKFFVLFLTQSHFLLLLVL